MFNEKKYMKEYWIKNKKYLRKYHKNWVKENKENLKKYDKQYYQNNKEYLKKLHKQWRKENAEYKKKCDKQYYQKNIEHHKKLNRHWKKDNPEYMKQWCKDNPAYHRNWLKTEKGKANNQRNHSTRQAKEKNIINTLNFDEWLDILKRYKYRCAYCGKEFDLFDRPERDHIIPISKGGDNVKENIVPACRSCNARKKDKILKQQIRG